MATDGIALAYFPFRANAPMAKLIFYHGASANSLAGYQQLAIDLSKKYRISTYLVDIRGHGHSGGARGDAPDYEQVWRDVATVVSRIKTENPGAPLFLGGHSAGAGVVLNYLSRYGAGPIQGFVFVAPGLGLGDGVEHTIRSETIADLVTVHSSALILNLLTGGWLCGDCRAIDFNYSKELIKSIGMLNTYTVNMVNALLPRHPYDQLAALTGHLGVWIGEEDELFDAKKLKAFIDAARSPNLTVDFYSIPQVSHMSILINTHIDALISDWIRKAAKRR